MAIINFQGVTEVFYNRHGIDEVWYKGQKIWQKRKLNRIAVRNVTLEFGAYVVNRSFSYEVILTSSSDNVRDLFEQFEPSRLIYGENEVTILESEAMGSRSVLLTLEKPNENKAYKTFKESVVYFE